MPIEEHRVPHNKSAKQLLRYIKAKKKYEYNKSKGQCTYKEFAKVVGMHLNLTMPSLRGWHR